MRRIFSHFAKMSVAVLMILFSMLAHAGSPFAEPAIQRFRIDLISKPEWVEATRVYGSPEKLTVRLASGENRIIQVADFIQEGEANPELVSVFKNTVNSHPTLFVIVKWHYYLSAVDTEGDYYEVHAYGTPESVDGISLPENKHLTRFFGAGFDGKKEGELEHFRYKDAISIRGALQLNK